MPNKKFIFIAFFVSVVFAANVSAQQTTKDTTTADETFKVEITDKKIVETDYESKVELSVKREQQPPVSVNVGAGVRAERITVTLKNVFGDVRFRGSLEKILNQINLLRPPNENR